MGPPSLDGASLKRDNPPRDGPRVSQRDAPVRPRRGGRPRGAGPTPRRSRRLVGLAVGTLAALVGTSAGATAPGGTSRPAASATAHVVTDTSQVLPRWTPSAGILTSYGQDLAKDDGGAIVIRRRTTTNLTLALGLFDRAEVFADLPMVLHQQGTMTDQSGDPATASGLQASALGDLRMGLKGTILRTPRRGFGLGIVLDATAPTGDRSALAGSGGVQISSRLLAEQTLARGITVAANAGYLMRPDLRVGDVVVGDAVTLATALRVPLDRRQIVAWVGEVESYIGVAPGSSHAVALRTGLRAQLRSGMVLGLYGGGAPATAVGVPQVQGMLAIHWVSPKRMRAERAFDGTERVHATEVARRHDDRRLLTQAGPTKAVDPADPDGDGLLAAMDRCPNVAEDVDGFEDRDGCPDLDNDGDGLRDVLDQCPAAPELVNGALDWDGCPDMIVDGKVIALREIDPARLVPRVAFVPGSADLDETTTEALSAFAELMQLNPWLGTLTMRVYVGPTGNPVADRGLAEKRASALVGLLAARGVASDRVRVESPRAVTGGVQERARLAWANDPAAAIPDGTAPSGPADATLDRLLADADHQARQAVAAPDESEPDLAQGPASSGRTSTTTSTAQSPAEPPQPQSVSGAPVTRPSAAKRAPSR